MTSLSNPTCNLAPLPRPKVSAFCFKNQENVSGNYRSHQFSVWRVLLTLPQHSSHLWIDRMILYSTSLHFLLWCMVWAPILVKTQYEGYIWLNLTFIYGSTLSPSPSLSIPSASRCRFTYAASHLKHQVLIKADFLIHGVMVILMYTYLCLRASDKNSIIVIISYFLLCHL